MRIDIFVRNDIFMQIFCTIHATTHMSSFPQCSKTHGNFLSSLQSFAPNTSLLFYSQIFCTDKGHQSLFGLVADSQWLPALLALCFFLCSLSRGRYRLAQKDDICVCHLLYSKIKFWFTTNDLEIRWFMYTSNHWINLSIFYLVTVQ